MDISKKSLNIIKSYIDASTETIRLEMDRRFNEHDLRFDKIENQLVEIKSDVKQLRLPDCQVSLTLS